MFERFLEPSRMITLVGVDFNSEIKNTNEFNIARVK